MDCLSVDLIILNLLVKSSSSVPVGPQKIKLDESRAFIFSSRRVRTLGFDPQEAQGASAGLWG